MAHIFKLFKTHFSGRKHAHNLHQTFIGQLSRARDQNVNVNRNCIFISTYLVKQPFATDS